MDRTRSVTSSHSKRAVSPTALSPKPKPKKNAWSIPTATREQRALQLPPASTKYTPNYEAVRGKNPSCTIGTKPAVKAKASTPAPGQYSVGTDNYKGKFFLSKLPKTSFIGPKSRIAEREMEGPPEFCKARGGKISGLPRFCVEKRAGGDLGPGSYSASTLPVKHTPGPSFSKAGRGPAVAKALRGIPGPGAYEVTDRTIGTRSAMDDISFASAVYMSRHINVDDEMVWGGGDQQAVAARGRKAAAADTKFLQATNQEIQRWKMMSACHGL